MTSKTLLLNHIESQTIPLKITLITILTLLSYSLKLYLPFTPVPVTGQVFFALISGILLGPYYGAMSQIMAIGLALSSGPLFGFSILSVTHLVGPTGGYIIAFPISAFLTGQLLEIHQTDWMKYLAPILALLVIYTLGAYHLTNILGISFNKAIVLGIIPFIPADIVKVSLIIMIMKGMRI